MFIECTIRRKLGTHPEIDGTTYHFMPIATGEHVAIVPDEAHAERLLAIPSFREFPEGRVEFIPVEPPPEKVEPELVGTQVATPNVADMSREQLIGYADILGMRKPHPAIGTDKLRGNVAAFLELRASGDNDDPVEPEEDPKE